MIKKLNGLLWLSRKGRSKAPLALSFLDKSPITKDAGEKYIGQEHCVKPIFKGYMIYKSIETKIQLILT